MLPPATGEAFAAAIGAAAPEIVPGASHFLQEDQGELIGRRIADWLTLRYARELLLLVAGLEAGLGLRGAQLVAAAGVRVGLEQDAVGLHRAGDALGRRARQQRR